MAQVIGIGGIFFKFKDPKAMREWYQSVFGLVTNDYGVLFEFNGNSSPKPGYLQLGTFEESTNYFGKAEQQSMINYRVDNMVEFEEVLREKKVKILDAMAEYSYGKFLQIEDPEGNQIELWEPMSDEFGKSDEGKVVMR